MKPGIISAISAMTVIVAITASGCSKSTPPSPSVSGPKKFFVVPAISKDTKVGELVLGHTTLKEALEILPAFPDHPPAPRAEKLGPGHIGKTREVMENVDVVYNPMWSPLTLLFDRNNKLVIVTRSFVSDERKEARKIYEQHKQQLKEVYRESTTILQGEIQACITMEVTLDKSGDPNPIAYIYTCSTR